MDSVIEQALTSKCSNDNVPIIENIAAAPSLPIGFIAKSKDFNRRNFNVRLNNKAASGARNKNMLYEIK